MVPTSATHSPVRLRYPAVAANPCGRNNNPLRAHPVFEGVRAAADYYFVHSFAVRPEAQGDALAVTEYGSAFTSAIARANVLGVQFHPEKSQTSGLRILENFANWDGTC